jgi:hypothetical protein
MSWLVATPAQMVRLGVTLERELAIGLAPFEARTREGEGLRLSIHLLVGVLPEFFEPEVEPEPSDEELEQARDLLRTCGLPLASVVYKLLGDPERAHRAVKWAVAGELTRRCPGPRGGVDERALARRGTYPKLIHRLQDDGIILISRKTRRVVEHPGGLGLLERLTLRELYLMHPGTLSDAELWGRVKHAAEGMIFPGYQQFLLRLVGHGFIIPREERRGWVFQAPAKVLPYRMEDLWKRWEGLHVWLPELRRRTRACVAGEEGARSHLIEVRVSREDLPAVQGEIQATFERVLRSGNDLEQGTQLSDQTKNGRLLIFTHKEYGLLDLRRKHETRRKGSMDTG